MAMNWWKFSFDVAMASLQAQRVVGLRLAKLFKGGPSAQREARRAVVEQGAAAAEMGLAVSSDRTPQSMLRRYRAILRANDKRLTNAATVDR